MAEHYSIDGGTIQVRVTTDDDWGTKEEGGSVRSMFVGTMGVSCGSAGDRSSLELKFYLRSSDDEPVVTITVPSLYLDRFFSYVAGAAAMIYARDIENEMDADEAANEDDGA